MLADLVELVQQPGWGLLPCTGRAGCAATGGGKYRRAMTLVVFETHATTQDNEAGRATGWLPGALSSAGRAQAAELGRRRRTDGIDVVLCSDLRRAVQTVQIAFGEADPPVLLDWRLRECDYGELNGSPAAELHAGRTAHLRLPYPGGESWQDAVDRVDAALRDVLRRWPDGRVLLVGHVATRWALDRRAGRSLEALAAEEFSWQPGWEYRLCIGA